MDWGQLKRLRMNCPPAAFVDAFQGRLTGLKELTFGPSLTDEWQNYERSLCGRHGEDAALRAKYEVFIDTLPPLKGLHVAGTGQHLDYSRLLRKHGDSLESFHVHEFEGACKDYNLSRPTLDEAALREITLQAPELRSLTVDLARTNGNGSNDWPWEAMDIMVSNLPHLHELSIGFELEDNRERVPVRQCCIGSHVSDEVRERYCTIHPLLEPQLDGTEALKIFKYLRETNPHLHSLTLAAGDSRHMSSGLPVFFHDEANERVVYGCGLERTSADGHICCRPVHLPERLISEDGDVIGHWRAMHTACDIS